MGSIPIICTKKKNPPMGGFSFWCDFWEEKPYATFLGVGLPT
jgi:hypothetical protein